MRKINYDAIKDELANSEKKNYKKVDEKLYTPKLVNESAVVLMRFLPAPEGDVTSNIAKVLNHSYKDKNTGKWLITKCPRTNGWEEKCPICDYASDKWHNDKYVGKAGNKKIAGLFHKPSYFANILVIKDINTPENNGKIFTYRFGTKLYDKLHGKMFPSDEAKELGEVPVNIFDYEHGANFTLKVKVVNYKDKETGESESNRNYDDSVFSIPSMISLDGKKPLTEAQVDEFIEPNLIPLKPYMEDDMESFEKISDRLNRFLGVQVSASSESAPASSGTVKGSFEETLSEKPRTEPEAEVEDNPEDFFAKLRGQN